jgi:hypothetical protein
MDQQPLTAPGPLGADEPLLAAAVGANWDYYRPRFAARAAGGPWWMWNHAAALVPFWMSFRRLDVSLAVHFIQVLGFAVIAQLGSEAVGAGTATVLGLVIPLGVTAALQGGFGTSQVYRLARRAVAIARRQHGEDVAAAAAALARRAPRLTAGAITLHVAGSVIMLALFAAIVAAFAPHSHDRTMAYRAAMKSDLRNLVTHQEAVLADSGRYTTAPDTMFYRASSGVTVTVAEASADGFRAMAVHERLPGCVCEIAVGAGVGTGADSARSETPECHETDRR